MIEDPMAARVLEVSASAFATSASHRLLDRIPELRTTYGTNAARVWKDHFHQQIKELSVAINEREPRLFANHVLWSKELLASRDVPERFLQVSLRCLDEVLEEELPEANRSVPRQYVATALKSLEQSPADSAGSRLTDDNSTFAMQYLLEILEGNCRDAIELIIRLHHAGLAVEDAYHVLMLAQQEIGKMWHRNEVSVAEEHVVTSTTKRVMAILAHLAEKQPANGLTVICAAVEQNAHDVGVSMIADFFEFAGWRSVCLGSDLPAREIADAADYFDASLVALSATLTAQLPAVRAAIEAVKQTEPDCKVIVGGAAFEAASDLWRQVGADAFGASPADAVRTAGEMIDQAKSNNG